MKYQVGDKIIVLHSDEEGTVVEIMNERMVLIDVRGVKFPAYMDQIDFPYFKMFSQKKVPEKKKIFIDDVRREKTPKKQKVKDGVFLNFMPVFGKDVFDDEVVDKLKVYLINHNEEGYTFHYYLNFTGEVHFELKGTLDGLSEFYLHDVDFEDVSDNPKFEFEFGLQKPLKNKAEWFEAGLKLKGKQLFKKVEELQIKNEASFTYELFSVYPDRKKEEKIDLSRLGSAGYRVYDAGKAREYLPPPQSVVDLHIEKITDSWSHLKPFEILDMQLRYFEKYYELAVVNFQNSLIIIHGVGEGRLRDELHELLRLKKNVSSFVNQFHPLYGYGATEISLKY